MAKPEKFGHLYLVYHFTVPLNCINGTKCTKRQNLLKHDRRGQYIDLQYKWLVSIWNATMGWNGLTNSALSCFKVFH